MLYRVILFFYMLVLYYKSDRAVYLDHTSIQVGQGSKRYNEDAAHTSTTPNITDCTTDKKSISQFDGSLLRETPHFYYANNMTMRLPKLVNLLIDMAIEKEVRKRAIALINFTSFGRLCPFKAIHIFTAVLEEATASLQYALKSKRKSPHKEAMLLALRHQQKGLNQFNSRFFNQLLGKKSDETKLQAIRRTQQELKNGDRYVKHIVSAINSHK